MKFIKYMTLSRLFSLQELRGGTDQFTVVSHLLKNPIITRFIQIIPLAWHGAIAMRSTRKGYIYTNVGRVALIF